MVDFAIVVAVIVGVSQLVKQYVATKYIPLINLVLGVIAGVVYLGTGDIRTDILYGVAIGLSASGLFDLSKVAAKPAPKG